MRSIYDFIIKPVGKRYDNEIKVGERDKGWRAYPYNKQLYRKL